MAHTNYPFDPTHETGLLFAPCAMLEQIKFQHMRWTASDPCTPSASKLCSLHCTYLTWPRTVRCSVCIVTDLVDAPSNLCFRDLNKSHTRPIHFFGSHAGDRGSGVLIEHVSLVRFIDVAHICGLPEVYILSFTDNEGGPTQSILLTQQREGFDHDGFLLLCVPC